MPWALLLRMLARLGAAVFLWRVGQRRRGAPPPRIRRDETLRTVRESASLGWRAVSAAAFLVASAVLLISGVTLTVLSPRGLGIALLVLAAMALALTAVEIVAARRLFGDWQRRRRDAALRRQVS
ncbi:MAG: hypothetical protein ABR498_07215 [Candidatus Dormibacteria bacterium]